MACCSRSSGARLGTAASLVRGWSASRRAGDRNGLELARAGTSIDNSSRLGALGVGAWRSGSDARVLRCPAAWGHDIGHHPSGCSTKSSCELTPHLSVVPAGTSAQERRASRTLATGRQQPSQRTGTCCRDRCRRTASHRENRRRSRRQRLPRETVARSPLTRGP